MKLKIFLATLLLMFLFCGAGNGLAQTMTDAQKQALIVQLQQQIAQLMQQVVQVSAQQQWCYTFNNNLGTSSSGTDVMELHIALVKEGFSYSPDGASAYSTGTINAVAQFQTKYNISPQQGYTGPLTRTKLNQLYGCSVGPVNPVNPITSCTPNWQCTTWSSCSGSQQTRICTDSNNCNTTANKPNTTQSCSSSCNPNWYCGDWGACSGGRQTRTCTDYYNCGYSTNAPATTQSCTSSCTPYWQYGTWSSCYNGQQTRYIYDGNNCGITTSKPATTQPCSACVSVWQYGTWSSCNNNGQQTRTVTDTNNCSVATNRPSTTQACTPGSTGCADSDWTSSSSPSDCPSTGIQTKTWTKIGTCSGGVSHLSTETVSCTYQGPTCTSFAYSDWSACANPGTKTRTVVSSSPSGCVGGSPVTSITCTPCNPVWQYSDWSTCTNGVQTRTTADLRNCGITIGKPFTSQPCTATCTPNRRDIYISTCVSGQQKITYYAYGSDNCGLPNNTVITQPCDSDPNYLFVWVGPWSSCVNGKQTRTIANPSAYYGNPATTQSCTSSCTPNWQIGDWGSCATNSNGSSIQTRTVTDLNSCGLEGPEKNQSCTLAGATCTDTDGGMNYDAKGTVTINGTITVTHDDFCTANGTPGDLGEYSCQAGGSFALTYAKCPNGCENGACKRSATAPYITVTSPNGGEKIALGGTAQITWDAPARAGDSTTPISNFKIDLYKAGAFLQTIADNVANNSTYDMTRNTYAWTVPANLVSAIDYKIRISKSGDVTIYDESNANFSISRASDITTNTPNGGDIIAPGSTSTIIWDTTRKYDAATGHAVAAIPTVKIDLYKAGNFLQTIVASTASNGTYGMGNTYAWSVPVNLAAGNDYKVRISKVGDATIYDESDASFSFSAVKPLRSVTVISPNGGESFAAGSEQTITWTSDGDLNATKVKIVLYAAGQDIQNTVALNAPNTGSYAWKVAGNLPARSDYHFRISNSGDATVYGESNANFSIFVIPRSQSIAVTSPNGGEQLVETLGSTFKITWDTKTAGSDPLPITNVFIQLFKGGVFYSTIFPDVSLAYNRAYTWSLAGLPAGNDYKVKVCNYNATLVCDESDDNFSIAVVSRSLTVTSPTIGDKWKIGETHNITWSSSGQPANSMMGILLVARGSYGNPDYSHSYNITPLATSSSGVQLPQTVLLSLGSYSWKIPSTVLPGTYSIEMQDNKGYQTIFSNAFSITTGATTSTTTVSCTDTDGGVNYESKGSATGMSPWTGKVETYVDACNTYAGRNNLYEYSCGTGVSATKITREDYVCPNGCTDGACNRAANQPYVAVTSPNGGETFTKGNDIVVRWSSQGVNGVFIQAQYYTANNILDASNPINGDLINGGAECRVTDLIPASTGTFTIKGGNTLKCGLLPENARIKILVLGSTLAGAPVGDESDNYFSITAPTSTATSCTDADTGKNYNVKGKTTGTNGAFDDYCTGRTLTEYYCSGNTAVSENVTCPAGCLAGKCDSSAPYITITTPNGGRITPGSSYAIRWISFGASQTNVSLSLVQNGATNSIIATNIPNNGMYTWRVPGNLSGAGFKVYIATSSGLTDYSDSAFAIGSGAALNEAENSLASISDAIAKLLEQVKVLLGQ